MNARRIWLSCRSTSNAALRMVLLGGVALAGVALSGGCAGNMPSAEDMTFRMNDAVALAKLRSPDNEVELIYKTPAGLPQTFYFGDVTLATVNGGSTPQQAFIAVRNGRAWKALVLTDSHLVNPYWEFVAAGPRTGEVWGVLNSGWTHRAADLVLAHTTDNGVTWKLSPVRKPVYTAQYNDFCMSPGGHGRLTMVLPAALDGHEVGYYHYVTSDGGQSWSAPRFEADALTVGDEVPENEQPSTLQHMAAK